MCFSLALLNTSLRRANFFWCLFKASSAESVVEVVLSFVTVFVIDVTVVSSDDEDDEDAVDDVAPSVIRLVL